MKNVVKLSFLTAGIVLSSSLFAQGDIKKEAVNTSEKLEAPKATETKSDAKIEKQEPVKKTTANEASKSTSKADTTSTGGTRMAITVQGTPKKNKNKNAKSSTTTTEPPKK
jgi:hypothetical protein